MCSFLDDVVPNLLIMGALCSYIGSAEGVRPEIGPKRAKMIQNTTKIIIFAFLGVSKMTLEFLFRVVRRLFQGNTLYV